MTDPDFIVPAEQLPAGFAEALDRPPGHPVKPRPAATIALLREGGHEGLEVLLLRRVRTSGFVPGAWVFPGGRVDSDDAGPELVARTDGLTEQDASRRLGLVRGAEPAAMAYYLAAVREAFEETGLLVARGDGGAPPESAADDPAMRTARDALLESEPAFPDLLDRLGLRIDGGAITYVAHWITPEAEPRRYDTRFFAAVVPPDRPVLLHPKEMSDALWLGPAEALLRWREGTLPMVFPTIRTLEDLCGFGGPEAAVAHFRRQRIPTVLPRLVRTKDGVGIEIPE